MEVERIETEQGPVFRLKQESVILSIHFDSENNLYWTVENLDKEDFMAYQAFFITPENYIVYSLFQRLFERIENCQVFVPSETELASAKTEEEVAELQKRTASANESMRNSGSYRRLFENSTISWISDDRDLDCMNYVDIRRDGTDILLDFYKARRESVTPLEHLRDNIHAIGIRFNAYDSHYDPFNMIFIELYDELNKWYYPYEQLQLDGMSFDEGQGRK